jgi:hypothetical protein
MGAALAAPVTINELAPDAVGADDGQEWIELYNASDAPVDLTGWSLWSGTSALALRYTWTSGSIGAGEHLVVGGADAALSLGNAGSSADAVALVDAGGAVVDTVIYGSPNTDAFLDDRGEVATSLAPVPGEGQSLARASDGVDTDDAGDDFVVATTPTPGAENVDPTAGPCAPSIGGVVVNELVPDPDGDDAGLEWVELYNGGSTPASLGGWTLTAATSAFDAPDFTFPADAVLAPGAFLVIGGAEAPVDLVAGFSIGNGTDTDGLRLADCAGEPVDTVLYGESPNADQLSDDLGVVAAPYGDPDRDQSLGRLEDGVDSDAASDWLVYGIPTPGAPNVVPDLPDSADTGADGCRMTEPSADPPRGCGMGPSPTAALLFLPLVGARRRRAS